MFDITKTTVHFLFMKTPPFDKISLMMSPRKPHYLYLYFQTCIKPLKMNSEFEWVPSFWYIHHTMSRKHVTILYLGKCHSVSKSPAASLEQKQINSILLSLSPKTDIGIKRLAGFSQRIVALLKYNCSTLSKGVCEILWHQTPPFNGIRPTAQINAS